MKIFKINQKYIKLFINNSIFLIFFFLTVSCEKQNNSKSTIIEKLLRDEFSEPGSARNRKSNAPENGKLTLL